MYLSKYKALWTNDPATAFEGVSARQPGFRRIKSAKSEGWKFRINYCALGSIGLTYGDTSAWSHHYDGDEFVRLALQLSGEITTLFARSTRRMSDGLFFVPPDGYWGDTSGGETVLLRLERQGVVNAVESLDNPLDVTQRLYDVWHQRTRELAAFARTVRHALAQIDAEHGMLDQPAFTRVYEDLFYLHAAQSLVGEAGSGARAFNQPALRRVLEYVEAHFSDHLTVSEAAKAGGVSVRALQLLFRQHLGRTFVSFLTERRLLEARQMLSAGHQSLTVTNVATACGFSHLSQFSGNYLAAYGEKPSQTLARSRRGG